MAGLLVGCSSNSHGLTEEPAEPYVSPYDWKNLAWEGGRPVYYENGKLCSRWGVDVSEHQGTVNWESVAGAGVQFAFVRIGNRGATEGALGADDYFHENALGAHEVGIPVNAYFFSQSVNEEEAREEAEFALAQLRGVEEQGVTFSVVAYDHEPVEIAGARANDLSPEQFTANARAFCEVVAQAGYTPMLYGNQSDLLRISEEVRDAYGVWLAEYGVGAPTAPLDFTIWQYTHTGSIPGIRTDADLNLWIELG